MPIYEFFCSDCNTIFNFFSRTVNTDKRPDCPRCGRSEMQKMLSPFAVVSKAEQEDENDPLAGVDETKLEQAFASLMSEAEGINEDDPRQMANLMRKFSQKTGISLGGPMEEALQRMEAGEDPEVIEQEMGDLLDGDELFTLENMKKKVASRRNQPRRDETLYEL